MSSRSSTTSSSIRRRRNTISVDRSNSNHDDHFNANTIHTLPTEEIEQYFRTDMDCGLDSEYAEYLLSANGLNQLTPPKKDAVWIKWFKHVFGGIFNILLWTASSIQILMWIFVATEETSNLELLVPATLIFVVISSGTFQFYQEMKSEKIMSSFSKFQPSKVRVIRDGKETELAPEYLVTGDIILLSAGEKISCDVIVIESTSDLMVDNASLTGESEPQIRSNKCTNTDFMLTENVCFFGTLCLKGKAKGIVYKTGDDTFLGQIAATSFAKAVKNKNESIFEQEIEHFVQLISWIAIFIGIVCMSFDISKGESWRNTINFGISIIFANIPEGLLATVTLALTLSAYRMSKKHVLIRNLQSIETLGCISVICSDKTGTITTGKMSVSNVFVSNNEHIEILQARKLMTKMERYSYYALFRVAVCCNNAHIELSADHEQKQQQQEEKKEETVSDDRDQRSEHSQHGNVQYKVSGFPTETGILRASIPIIGGIEKVQELKERYVLVHEIPFNSDNKWHLTIHQQRDSQEYILQIKGAPEIILNLCGYYYDKKEQKSTLNADAISKIQKNIHKAATYGERVLCFAESKFTMDNDSNFAFNGECFETANWFIENVRGGKGMLTFIGFMSLIDPPRPEVTRSIEKCHRAGIKVVMITGDHKVTAAAIAKHVGIIQHSNHNSKEGSVEAAEAESAGTMTVAHDTVIDMGSDYRVIEGSEIDRILTTYTDIEQTVYWDKVIACSSLVFARTTPVHKQIIVEQFQKRGYVVSVTGDGVNDAPALNTANVGISMGLNGTDVARESSDIILMNDNFSSIIDGIFEGRLITENLKKSIVYTLCSKLPQLLPVIIHNVTGRPLAMTIMQVLLIDLGTDIWTGVAMAYEKAEDNLMLSKPRNIHKNPLVSWKMIMFSYLHIGIIQALGCFLAFQQILNDNGNGIGFLDLFTISKSDWHRGWQKESLMCYKNGDGCYFQADAKPEMTLHHEITVQEQFVLLERAQTVYYVSLILMQIVTAISCETRINSIVFKHGLFTNWYLNACLLFELLFGISVVYVPFMQHLFGTQPLEPACWFAVTPFIVLLFTVEETRKYILRANLKADGTADQNNWFVNMLSW